MPEPTSTEFVLPNTMSDWPWLRRINPHFETVKAESEAWFRTFNAFSPKAQKAFEKCDFCRLASLAYPALNKQRLRTGCDLMMLFFTFDEYTDVLPAPEVRRYADIVMDALKNPNKPRPEGEHVVGEVARQFWALGIQSATPLAQKHFLKTFEDYIYSVVDQASDRDDERIRGSEEYIILRRRTIGLHPSYPMQELGMDLVDEIWNHPVIDELRRIAVDIVLLDNDICSYKKELAQGDDTHNIVTIIMHEQTTDVRGAMEWVATQRKALTSQFIALYKKVPWDDVDAQVREYVEGIANWPRANDSWIFESGRYFGYEGLKVQKDRKVVLSSPGSAKFFG
ncbi:Terpene cyclase [Mycena sanguinolenta]|uniref:Terpene synthase n=1 Tax=Mycena sanguinolenta TaxID=230812 RepID=A0A8H6ZGN1_9AGAR|nr:Terpene cyclase [Mycena sanguinolenta]